jgi:hypothetical protein
VHVDAHAGVIAKGRVQIPGTVRTAVIHDDEFDFAGEINIKDVFDRRDQGRLFVVHRHQDGKFHSGSLRERAALMAYKVSSHDKLHAIGWVCFVQNSLKGN